MDFLKMLPVILPKNLPEQYFFQYYRNGYNVSKYLCVKPDMQYHVQSLIESMAPVDDLAEKCIIVASSGKIITDEPTPLH